MVKLVGKALADQILKLYSKLGGNVGEVLGTRSNINFLGIGKSPEGFIDSTINIDAIGALGKNKVLEELKSSMGYLTADKLNDVQAGKLYENMLKIDEVFNPKVTANIIDMGTGTRNLTDEGLGALRATRKTDDDVRVINDELDLPPLREVIDARNEQSLVLPPLKGASNEITALETMTKNKAGTEFFTGFVDDVYRNSGVTASVDVA